MRLFFLLTVAALLSGIQPSYAETAFERVLRTNTLRCAYASIDPYIYKDIKTDRVNGFIADIAREMGKRLDLKVEYVAEVGFADFAEGFKTGRYDAFCGGMTVTPKRTRVALYTYPLGKVPHYAYLKKGEDRFEIEEDMNSSEFKAGSIDGEVFEIFTKKFFPKSQIISYPNLTLPGQLFVDLADGKYDFLVHDDLIYGQYKTANKGKVVRAFGKPLETNPIAFSVGIGEQNLLEMLNTTIQLMHDDGVIDRILNQNNIGDASLIRVHSPYN